MFIQSREWKAGLKNVLFFQYQSQLFKVAVVLMSVALS